MRRFVYLSIGVLLLISGRWSAGSRQPGAFTPFVPQALERSAVSDFDADGRPDLARIQDVEGGSQVRLTLVGSSTTVTLVTNAVSVVASDIDHDGDTDLVMVTPSRQIAIWLNDGYGQSTEPQPRSSRSLSSAATILSASQELLAALGPTAPIGVGPDPRQETAVIGTSIRHPTRSLVLALSAFVLPSFRAPPLASIFN